MMEIKDYQAAQRKIKSSRKPTNARLQNKILFFLEEAKEMSVTAMAAKIGVQRSSTSRALNALKRDGLVLKEGKTWHLSDRGKDELVYLRNSLQGQAIKANKTASNLLETLAITHKNFEALYKDMTEIGSMALMLTKSNDLLGIGGTASMLAKSNDLLGIGRTASMLAKSNDLLGIGGTASMLAKSNDLLGIGGIASMLAKSNDLLGIGTTSSILAKNNDLLGIGSIASSMNSFLSSQKIAINAYSRIASDAGKWKGISGSIVGSLMESQLNTTNIGISRIVGDISAIHSYARLYGSMPSRLNPLLGSIGHVAKSYNEYLRDVVQPEFTQKPQNIVIPTWTTGNLISTARDAIIPEENDKQLILPDNDEFGITEELLASVDMKLVHKWQGAKAAILNSNINPDSACQVAHSLRELLRQLLKCMAPDDDFTQQEIKQSEHRKNNGEPSITRKMRVRKILGNTSEAKLIICQANTIESIADLVEATYQNLSKEAHNETGVPAFLETQLFGLMHSMTGWIMLIIRPKVND